MFIVTFHVANIRNNFESSKWRRDFFLPASVILVFLGSRRKKGNHRNNLAVSAESEGSHFLYFFYFFDLKVRSVALQSAGPTNSAQQNHPQNLLSRRNKRNSRNNLAASAESEESNFLYFLHFCGTNKIK
jgi:hypothetical protein